MIATALFKNIHKYYALLRTYSKKMPPEYKAIPLSFIPFLIPRKQNSKTDDIIKEADMLFEESRFVDVYKLLEQHKSKEDAEIRWRVARALFKMSQNQNDTNKEKELLKEAYDVITPCLKEKSDIAEVYKWSAVLYDQLLRVENRIPSLSETLKVKEQLLEAHKLNPNDYAVLYLLGSWCYNMSSLSWLRKKLWRLLFWNEPAASYEEALDYFLRAEELKPRLYASNVYMLGKINYEMGNMYRAHYYLKIASEMTAATDYEYACVTLAKKLLKNLNDYKTTEEAL